MTNNEEIEVKQMIQSFYRFANVVPPWDGDVNDRVAEIFGVILDETRKCSKALGWVPPHLADERLLAGLRCS